MVFICKCTNQGRKIENASNLSRHIRLCHSNKDEFYCIVPNCLQKIIKHSGNILRHFKTHHLNENGFEFLKAKQDVSYSTNNPRFQEKDLIFEKLDNFSDSEYLNDFNSINDFENDLKTSDQSIQIDETLPGLLNQQIKKKSELSIEDECCNLIVKQKKKFKITQTASIGIPDEWLEFISSRLRTGNLNFNFFYFIILIFLFYFNI